MSVDSDTQITATSPAGSGAVDVTVVTPGGTSATSAADQFTYNAAGPTITGINPTSGSAAGGDSVTITGSGFTGATEVDFGGTAATSMSVDSDTQITATSPAGSGTVDVTVITPGGTSATGAADQFTYNAAGPTISGINPTSGSAAGGDSVTITGAASPELRRSISAGTAATSMNVDSDTQITATSPAGSGMVDVTVVTPAGTSATSAADQFTYNAAGPTVTGINPTSGSAAGGDSVTITGSGFTGATEVDFGGTAATSISVDSDTRSPQRHLPEQAPWMSRSSRQLEHRPPAQPISSPTMRPAQRSPASTRPAVRQQAAIP